MTKRRTNQRDGEASAILCGRRQLLFAATGLIGLTAAGSVLAANQGTGDCSQSQEMRHRETAIEPKLPIIDAHHHMWATGGTLSKSAGDSSKLFDANEENPFAKDYLLPQLLADTSGGHNIRATVFVQCHSAYRPSGPAALKCVGETEFINGVAALSASGVYGETRACAAIVGFADLRLGDRVEPVLDEHLRFSDRFRGLRATLMWDDDPRLHFPMAEMHPRLAEDPAFRAGLKVMDRKGLNLDVLLFHTQANEVVSLARSNPNVTFVLNHIAFPLGIGPYADKQAEVFANWRTGISALAACPNVVMKLGGMGLPFLLSAVAASGTEPRSIQLARHWKPFVEQCISAFGTQRCMFESDFPIDSPICDYVTMWNSFKRIAAGYSESEKQDLFSGTAARVYKIHDVTI